ncbi:MAG: HEAT repeat domain-containing protein [Candidatus Eisenbacteria bacterium]
MATPSRDPVRLGVLRAEDARRADDPLLRRALKEADPLLRARAARACGRLQDSTLVPSLLPLLNDPASEVRQEAAFALGQIGHRSARMGLEVALGGSDPEVAFLAVEALGKLGDMAATPRVSAALGAVSARLRGEAAMALWRLADSTALPALLARHADPDPEVRWRVQYALEKIINPDRVVLISALHLNDSEWLTRAYAVRTIGRQKSTRGVAYLTERLGDPEPAVVVNALRALQFIADSTCGSCTQRIVRAMGHAEPYVRVTAATVLGDRFTMLAAGDVRRGIVLDSLRGRLRDPDAATRGAAARALLIHRGAQALADVRPVLEDTSIYARVAVLQTLARVDSAIALPILLARLGPSYPLFDRTTAADALGELRAVSVAPRLRAALADSALLLVASAAGALATLGDRASVPALTQTFVRRARDTDADARISIRDALRKLAGARFADSLERVHPAPRGHVAVTDDELGSLPAGRLAILHTTKGEIEWAFQGAEAPQTVRNFVKLASRGYFNGLSIHRVVPNFVIQDGDPTGTGSGGPGYSIRCEYNRLRYDPGMVGMALSGKDTGGSQWFITHSPQPHLNGRYTIFARVTRGLDVARRIVQGDRVLRVEILN